MARVPVHIARRYLRGQCWTMAVAMSEMSGLPLRGLRDQRGDIFHAFVADERAGVGYDVRGAFPLSRAAEGSADPKAAIVPLSLDEIERIDGVLQKPQLREAKSIARTYRLVPTGPDLQPPSVNTVITYQYRDAGNNKVARQAVFQGAASATVRRTILEGGEIDRRFRRADCPGRMG